MDVLWVGFLVVIAVVAFVVVGVVLILAKANDPEGG